VNYDRPRQRETDKRWDYTTGNRRTGVHPIGYCRAWPKSWYEHEGEEWLEKLKVNKDKFHDRGHDTAAEARECYHQYQLDNEVRIGKQPDQQRRCAECEKWTQDFVQVGGALGQINVLCEDHQDRETIEKHFNCYDSIHS
jgi:hypothetical protein